MAGDYVDETHERIAMFAEEFLDEDERDGFVDSLMERRGYQRTQHWAAPEPQQGQGQRGGPLLSQRQGQGAGQGRSQGQGQGQGGGQAQRGGQRQGYFRR